MNGDITFDLAIQVRLIQHCVFTPLLTDRQPRWATSDWYVWLMLYLMLYFMILWYCAMLLRLVVPYSCKCLFHFTCCSNTLLKICWRMIALRNGSVQPVKSRLLLCFRYHSYHCLHLYTAQQSDIATRINNVYDITISISYSRRHSIPGGP